MLLQRGAPTVVEVVVVASGWVVPVARGGGVMMLGVELVDDHGQTVDAHGGGDDGRRGRHHQDHQTQPSPSPPPRHLTPDPLLGGQRVAHRLTGTHPGPWPVTPDGVRRSSDHRAAADDCSGVALGMGGPTSNDVRRRPGQASTTWP